MERRQIHFEEVASPERIVFEPQAADFGSAAGMADLEPVIQDIQRNDNFMITDPQIDQKLQAEVSARLGIQQFQKKGQQIYHIDKAEPPTNFDGMYYPMPESVDFRRLVQNILTALEIKKDIEKEAGEHTAGANKVHHRRRTNKYEKWKNYLELEENKAIVSDAFWFYICKYKKKKYEQRKRDRENNPKLPQEEPFNYEHHVDIQENLLNRMAKNYVNMLQTIEDEEDKKVFFKRYFDIISQGVFYSYFYSFPKSRSEFNDELKKDLIDEFSYLFTGVPISNATKYWDKWNLDLGAGNILKKETSAHQQSQQTAPSSSHQQQRFAQQQFHHSGGGSTSNSFAGQRGASAAFDDRPENRVINLPQLPPQGIRKIRNPRVVREIRYSPIILRYLEKYKYKTRNTIQNFKMKFTQYDKNQELVDNHFRSYETVAYQIKDKSELMKKHNNQLMKDMKKEIASFKEETVQHHKRLEKRKAEELERGAHEYANYLVSMLNAGLSMANLGVST